MKKTFLFILMLLLLSSCVRDIPEETEPGVQAEAVMETEPVSPPTESEVMETLETAESETESVPPETEIVPDGAAEPVYAEVHEYFIDAAVHTELDFTYHDEYQNYAVCDFAIAPNGNLLLLTLSDSVWEFTPEGELVGRYRYDFAAEGLTAYMLTCDEYGNFYFADGKNDAIIKADREGILHVSMIGEEAKLYALTLSESMYARDEDCLEFLNYNENFEFCVYTVDVSRETAVSSGEPVLGQSLGGGNRAVVSMVKTEDGSRTPEFRMELYQKDGQTENYLFRSELENGTAVFGLGIYGLTGEESAGDTVVGYVREWYMDTVTGKEKTLDTKVKITRGAGITAVSKNQENNYKLTRTYGGETYILQRYENGIRVVPLGVLCAEEEWSGEVWFNTTID